MIYHFLYPRLRDIQARKKRAMRCSLATFAVACLTLLLIMIDGNMIADNVALAFCLFPLFFVSAGLTLLGGLAFASYTIQSRMIKTCIHRLENL